MKLGLEVLLESPQKIRSLKKSRVALVCHPASVDSKLRHSFDLLHQRLGLACAFGPQHGVQGEKQDNMIESDDILHPTARIPIYSLYGKVRRPTPEMMENFDVVLFDLQDLGCRIYTFITTLLYMMEECAKAGKKMVILDRPNPIGREIEGLLLVPGWESFVGAGPLPMRHGLTVAELALFFQDHFQLDLDLEIIPMKGYRPRGKPGFGWPSDRAWINPSPNAPTLNMARIYPGSVMIEGTTLSEGRGTTRALEVVGAADIDFTALLARMRAKAPQWMKGALLRECYFQPTFHKFSGQLCHGFQVHTDLPEYRPSQFRPYRLFVLMLKCLREMAPQYPLYRDFAYEYVEDKLAFDVIHGGPRIREWIEDLKQTPADLEKDLRRDEKKWAQQSRAFHLYR